MYLKEKVGQINGMIIALELNSVGDEENVLSKSKIHNIMKEAATIKSNKEIKEKSSLVIYCQLNHYVDGAKYLHVANKENRRIISNYRMYCFVCESSTVNGENVCVVLNYIFLLRENITFFIKPIVLYLVYVSISSYPSYHISEKSLKVE